MSPRYQSSTTELFERQSLEAVYNAACHRCGAPPTYVNHQSIKDGWPGCYVEADSVLVNQLCGPVCPNCGTMRPSNATKPLGEIWVREVRSPSPPPSWISRVLRRIGL